MSSLTKLQLMSALFNGSSLTLGTPTSGMVTLKVVNAVEREDGSGKSFNVKGIDMSGKARTVYARTID